MLEDPLNMKLKSPKSKNNQTISIKGTNLLRNKKIDNRSVGTIIL